MIHSRSTDRRSTVSPSFCHRPRNLAGHDHYGRDVLSQLIFGTARRFAGIVSAFFMTAKAPMLDFSPAISAAPSPARRCGSLMLFLGFLFLPFAVVLVALLRGPVSLSNIILTISCLLWRTTAGGPKCSACASGHSSRLPGWLARSDLRVMMVHIPPNVLPMSLP